MQTQRITYIDTAAGIMLAWMILCHTLGFAGVSTPLTMVAVSKLSFFMPFFFYKAGMFHRDSNITMDEVSRVASKLLIPFVIFSLLGQIIVSIGLYINGDFTFRNLVYRPLKNLYLYECLPGNGALWFLPALFIVKVISLFFFKRIHFVFLLFAGFGIAYICYMLQCNILPCIIPNVAAGLFFYVAGYKLHPKENNAWLVVMAALFYILWSVSPLKGIYFHHNTCSGWGDYIVFYPASICGIVVLNNLCHYVYRHLRRSGLFNWIGRNAMNLYVTHWMILVFVEIVFVKIIGATNFLFYIYLSCIIVLLPICNAIMNAIHYKVISKIKL